MHSSNFSSVFKIVLYTLLWKQQAKSCFGYTTGRNNVGVSFSPNVKQFEDGLPPPGDDSYTRENVKTMLKVILTEFSNVIVPGRFSSTEQYIVNHTYYNDSYAQLYSGEIAAQINRENKRKILTIIYFCAYNDASNDVDLAIEAAAKANNVFAGTVEGIIFDAYGEANESLSNLQSLQKKTAHLEIKTGLWSNCYDLLTNNEKIPSEIQRAIIKKSDIIHCSVKASGDLVSAFPLLAKQFWYFHQFARLISSTTEVIFMTEWSTAYLKDADDLRIFWEAATQWSTETNIRVYLSEAFDSPRRKIFAFSTGREAHSGWWKLTDNSKINSEEGYVKKTSAQCHSFQFDRKYVGVTFSPFVAQFSDGSRPRPFSDYTFENIQTMLNVLSVRFFNILSLGPFGDTDQYEYNVTYHKSFSVLRVGEAAAMLNQMQRNTVVTLIYYAYGADNPSKTKTEFLLACEAAEKANKIFPQTVTGVVVHAGSLVLTLELFRSLRRRAHDTGVKFGTSIDWWLLYNNNNTDQNLREVVKMSDFIVCSMPPISEHYGPTASFREFSFYISAIAEAVVRIKPATATFAITQWSSSGRFRWSTVENQRIYWETASEWAAEKNVHIFLAEAFDNPWRRTQVGEEDSAHRGWWKLDKINKINSLEDYVEKILELPGQCISKPPKIIRETQEPTDDKTAKAGWLTANTIGAATACIAILIIVVGILLWLRKRYPVIGSEELRKFFHGSSLRSSDETSEETASNRPYDKSLEIAKKNLKLGTNILGKGEFGLVYRAQVEFEGELVDVAVKVPKDNCPSNTLMGLLSEIKIMSYLGTHANIISLVGAYTAELSQGVVYVVTELCSLGSLEKYLRKSNTNASSDVREHNAEGGIEMTEVATASHEISFPSMLRWAHEIASGMDYLARKHVVHADLATRNVLLTSSKTAKISDFGLSRRMYNYKDYVKKNQEPLPWRWMAFEALDRSEFSSKSDAWSYGITLWEIFSKGSIPYSGLSWTHDFNKKLMDGLRPDCPLFASPEIFELMENCWKLEASDRPTFSEICRLTNILFHRDFDMENEEESAYLPIREIEIAEEADIVEA